METVVKLCRGCNSERASQGNDAGLCMQCWSRELAAELRRESLAVRLGAMTETASS